MIVIGYKHKYLTYEYISKKLEWIEVICLDLLNYSLQIPFIPIKKCMFLFSIYLKVLFEDDPNKNENFLESEEIGKSMKFMTEKSVDQMMKAPIRTSLKLQNQVEKFYVSYVC